MKPVEIGLAQSGWSFLLSFDMLALKRVLKEVARSVETLAKGDGCRSGMLGMLKMLGSLSAKVM